MSRLDIIIFGATGFTGRKAVEETVKMSRQFSLTWGVAGRSQTKLEELLAEVGNKTGENLSNIRVVIADVRDQEALKSMTAQAKVVANCCGPYRLYGEPVIEACVDTKTHHVDVSGEPQFIETVQWRYHKKARAAGVYVISACGFDSVPNDMGVVYLQQNFGGILNSVESYMSAEIPPEHRMAAFLGGTIHYGTWESLVHSLANAKELRPLREKVFPLRIPRMKPVLLPRGTLHRHAGGWCVPFPGADASVVYRTQRYQYEHQRLRPVQFKAYLKMPSLFSALLLIFNAIIISCMVANSFTRKLLLMFPRLFTMGMVSHSGPKEEVMNNTKFEVELIGEGWPEGVNIVDPPTPEPEKRVVAKVRGTNPGYGATVTALMYCALTVLKEESKMPSGGGVLTTGAAFGNTDLLKHLQENKFTFDIVGNENTAVRAD